MRIAFPTHWGLSRSDSSHLWTLQRAQGTAKESRARKQICINSIGNSALSLHQTNPNPYTCRTAAFPPWSRAGQTDGCSTNHTCNTNPATNSHFKTVSCLLMRHIKSRSSFLPLHTNISVYPEYHILQSTWQFRVSLPGPGTPAVKSREKLSPHGCCEQLLLSAATPGVTSTGPVTGASHGPEPATKRAGLRHRVERGKSSIKNRFSPRSYSKHLVKTSLSKVCFPVFWIKQLS